MPAIVWWSPLIAALVAFFVNFAWFNAKTFYPVWVRALGRDPSQAPEGNASMGAAFGSVIVSLLIQAYGLALVIALGLVIGLWH